MAGWGGGRHVGVHSSVQTVQLPGRQRERGGRRWEEG